MSRNFPHGYYKRFIPDQGIPERIFKYSNINDNLRSTLRDGYLWFSKPTEFNDPFDCYTELVEFRQPGQHMKDIAADRYRHLPRTERRAIGRNLAAQPAFINQIYRELLKQTMNIMGICCFTTKNDNVLMWSHYANNHRGICLIFDPLVDLSYFLIAGVTYTDEFEPLNYFQNTDDALMKMAVTKSLDWAYESETRVILPQQNGRRAFNKKALKGVIFGCRTSDTDIEEIQAILHGSGYNEIYFQKARMETNRFKLMITNL
jgi:hypothetical protein